MVDFNPETQIVIRNNRENYNVPENEKPKTDSLFLEVFGSADTSKTEYKTYNPYLDPEETGYQNTYYDSEGNEIGSATYWSHDGEHSMKIHTKDADYYDWDGNGTIDTKDTDKVYDKDELTRSPHTKHLFTETFFDRFKDLVDIPETQKVEKNLPRFSGLG